MYLRILHLCKVRQNMPSMYAMTSNMRYNKKCVMTSNVLIASKGLPSLIALLFMSHRMCSSATQHATICVRSLAVWNSDEEDSAESSTDDEATEEKPVAETPDEK